MYNELNTKLREMLLNHAGEFTGAADFAGEESDSDADDTKRVISWLSCCLCENRP